MSRKPNNHKTLCLTLTVVLLAITTACTQPHNEETKPIVLKPDSVKAKVQLPEAATVLKGESTIPNYCDIFNSLPEEEKTELIKNFYTRSHYLKGETCYLPLCVDGAYSELFAGVAFNTYTAQPAVFFDLLQLNRFTEPERDQLTGYFAMAFYNELSYLNEVEHSNLKGDKLKEELIKRVNRFFKSNKLEPGRQLINLAIRDSVMAFTERQQSE